MEKFLYLPEVIIFIGLIKQEAVEHAQATGHVNFQEYR